MLEAIRILLIEDNPGDARLIREMLIGTTRQHIEIDAVTTLKAGLAAVAQNNYDAILLDLFLPDSGGIDTVTKMEAVAGETAIVVLTGMEDEKLGIEAVQIGAQDYLPKIDVDSRLLIRSIRYAIERHRTESALRRNEREYRSLIDDVFDTSMVAVLILDRDFHVVWCNEATEIYFGIERDRLLGRDKRVLIDKELKCIFADPDDYSARLLKAYEDGDFMDRFECLVIPEGGRAERWLEHWSQPIRDGIYIGGRIEQYTDITQRKRLALAEREEREFAEALHDISTLLTSSLDLNEVLSRILRTLSRIVPHDTASITIIEDDHFQIAHQESMGRRGAQEVVAEKRLHLDYRPYAEAMFKTQQSVIIADMQQDLDLQTAAVEANVHAYAGVPILLQDNVIGFINLLSETVSFFKEEDSVRLIAFSKLAAIALQNARLFDQSRRLAAMEERQRLARELHDSVSQTLFTCRTMSETALRRWKKDPERARELMGDVNRLTTTALAEMRILLTELRPAALTQISLKELFEQYLQPIQDRREFELVMALDDISPLPPDVQIALYRITQEALNNIDKHAQARRVEVRAVEDPHRVILEIRDDGGGFAPEHVRPTSLGLGIMRERAEAIGATLAIDSQPGQGTQIKLTWEKDKAS